MGLESFPSKRGYFSDDQIKLQLTVESAPAGAETEGAMSGPEKFLLRGVTSPHL
jgi:hypothetical protein